MVDTDEESWLCEGVCRGEWCGGIIDGGSMGSMVRDVGVIDGGSIGAIVGDVCAVSNGEGDGALKALTGDALRGRAWLGEFVRRCPVERFEYVEPLGWFP